MWVAQSLNTVLYADIHTHNQPFVTTLPHKFTTLPPLSVQQLYCVCSIINCMFCGTSWASGGTHVGLKWPETNESNIMWAKWRAFYEIPPNYDRKLYNYKDGQITSRKWNHSRDSWILLEIGLGPITDLWIFLFYSIHQRSRYAYARPSLSWTHKYLWY